MRGSCSCGAVRYRLTDTPMIVHCCHCTWCRRETGSAFAINAVIERDRIEVEGAPEAVTTPSASGRGQEVFRCPECRVALWSHYGTAKRKAAFVRVGTMDVPGACPPDVHIFTSSKLPWVVLPDGARACADFYPDRAQVWSPEAIERWEALLAKAD